MQTQARGTSLTMRWTPRLQEMRVGSNAYVHEGETKTCPSHDLSHLLIAAASELEWSPGASDSSVRLAEYNTVLIEVLMSKVVHSARDKFVFQPSILGSTLKQMRWFVYEHYARFPMEAEEAYCRFCNGIDPVAVVRLSPLYFDLRLHELDCPEFMSKEWSLDFHSNESPPTNQITGQCQDILREQIQRLMTSANRRAAWQDLERPSLVPGPNVANAEADATASQIR